MLDDFEEARAIFALRKRSKQSWIDEHRERLVKAADEIFSMGQIDARFSPDGGIHLAEQCGGDLDQGDAAHENSGQEARDIGYDAAAYRDDEAGSVRALFDHLFGQRFHFRQSFARFSAREEERFRFSIASRGEEGGAMQLPDVFGGNKKQCAGASGDVVAQLRDTTALYQDWIGARGCFHHVRRHTIVVPCGLSASRSNSAPR